MSKEAAVDKLARTSGRPKLSYRDLLIVGGAAYWVQGNLATALYPGTVLLPTIASAPVWFIALVGNLCALSIMALASLRIERFTRSWGWVIGACVVLLLSIALVALVDFGLASDALLGAAVFAGGCGSGVVLVLQGELFSRLSLRDIFLVAGIQQVAAALAGLVLIPLPHTLLLLALSACVVLMALALGFAMKQPMDEASDADAGRAVPWLKPREALWVLVAVSAVIGLCYGAIAGLTSLRADPSSGTGGAVFPAGFDFMGIAAGGALLTLSGVLLRRGSPEEHLYKIAVPLLALGVALAPLLARGLFLSFPLLLACSAYFTGLLWFLVAIAHDSVRGEVGRLASASFCALFAGHLAGRAAVAFGPDIFGDGAFVAIALLLMIIGLLLLYISRYKSYERELVMRAEQRDFDLACERAAEKYGLTQREQTVFRLLALGFSVRRIAEKLVLSENTVKTHVRHVYEKVGVHSREEIGQLLESQ